MGKMVPSKTEPLKNTTFRINFPRNPINSGDFASGQRIAWKPETNPFQWELSCAEIQQGYYELLRFPYGKWLGNPIAYSSL